MRQGWAVNISEWFPCPENQPTMSVRTIISQREPRNTWLYLTTIQYRKIEKIHNIWTDRTTLYLFMFKTSWSLSCKRRVFQPELYLCHRIIHVMPRPRFRNNLLYTLFLAPTASSFIWYSAGPQLNCFVTFASYLNSSKNILLLAHFKAAILSCKSEKRDLVGPNLP